MAGFEDFLLGHVFAMSGTASEWHGIKDFKKPGFFF